MKKCLVALGAALFVAGCGHTASPQSATGSIHPPGWGVEGPPASAFLALAPNQTATMYDTVTLSTVPGHPFALAGYTAGHWPTFLPLRRSWPGAHTISIAISARDHADCLDVEPGDATPGEVPGWVRAEKRAGWKRPCVYSSWSEYVGQIRPALQRAGIHRWQVWEWDAHYTFFPHIDPGFDGTQWTDRAFGRNLDASLVLRSFLSIAHPPLTPTHPKRRPKPHKPTRRQRLETERDRLRGVLLAQHCRVKHPNRHCRGVLKTGARVNRGIRRLGGH